jgi:hypothetical protein
MQNLLARFHPSLLLVPRKRRRDKSPLLVFFEWLNARHISAVTRTHFRCVIAAH